MPSIAPFGRYDTNKCAVEYPRANDYFANYLPQTSSNVKSVKIQSCWDLYKLCSDPKSTKHSFKKWWSQFAANLRQRRDRQKNCLLPVGWVFSLSLLIYIWLLYSPKSKDCETFWIQTQNTLFFQKRNFSISNAMHVKLRNLPAKHANQTSSIKRFAFHPQSGNSSYEHIVPVFDIVAFTLPNVHEYCYHYSNIREFEWILTWVLQVYVPDLIKSHIKGISNDFSHKSISSSISKNPGVSFRVISSMGRQCP